jgi:hypothetical protein
MGDSKSASDYEENPVLESMLDLDSPLMLWVEILEIRKNGDKQNNSAHLRYPNM